MAAWNQVLKRKNNGDSCIIYGHPIWAVGSAIVETDMCLTCITSKADDSEDYEIV